jgi:phage tail-like protein
MAAASAELIVYLEGRAVQTLSLDSALITIGRGPDNRLALPHPLVARKHAELRIADDGSVLVVDLGGGAGTMLDEHKLLPNQPHRLDDGSRLRIGPFTLLYRAATAAEQEPAEPVAVADVTALPTAATVLPAPISRLRAGARPREPLPRLRALYSRYLQDLPTIYQDSDFLGRFLLIFENIWEPLETRQDHLDFLFHPYTCPAELLPWLAGQLGIELDRHWDETQRRAMVAEAYELYRWRGTRYGLTRLLEIATGMAVEISEEHGITHVMRVRIDLPAGGTLERDQVHALIRQHKPAHVGYILDVRSA